MTKRQLKTIISLYQAGVSTQVCIAIILELLGKDTSALDRADAIASFYSEISKAEKS